jgi:predicted nucleic acid-binding protein
MVLVDSSVWIIAGRRDGDLAVKVALESLLEVYEACWCGVVKLEVLGRVRAEQRRKLQFFFSMIPYRTITEKTWEAAKALGWTLRDAGLTVPNNDILQAALAIETGHRLYAIDHHFTEIAARVPALLLYQPGYGGSYDPGTE